MKIDKNIIIDKIYEIIKRYISSKIITFITIFIEVLLYLISII